MCRHNNPTNPPSQDPAAVLDALVDLDAVLPAFTGREPAPRWVDYGHEHLTMAEWRVVLVACRNARRTWRAGFGPRSVARAAAAEVLTAAPHVRLAVAQVLAYQGAKQELLVDLGAYWRELETADGFEAELRARPIVPCRLRGRQHRDVLPVEAARAVPILTLLERYGITCRRVGHEHLGRCPFGNHRRPHLTVNSQKGLWHCWPCDIGGDGIAFVMRLKRLDFAHAVQEVAA